MSRMRLIQAVLLLLYLITSTSKHIHPFFTVILFCILNKGSSCVKHTI